MIGRQTNDWSSLPQELVLKIIQRLVAGGQKGDAASARAACKGWCTASRQYSAALKCRQITDLRQLCTAFPLTASLELRIDDYIARKLQHLDYLQALTHLTQIHFKHIMDLSREADGPFEPPLGEMPKSIKVLKLENMAPDCSGNIFCNVTHLDYWTCMPVPCSQQALGYLLQDLPALEVLHLDTLDGPQVISTQRLQSGLAQVTHLRLSNGYVPHTLSWPSSGAAWKLQELEIDVMIRHQSWLNSLFSKSAQLTSLMLQIRTYPKQNLYLEWQLPPGLRKLVLRDYDDVMPMLPLLQSLSWASGFYAASAEKMAHIAAMTTLTFLELTKVRRFNGANQLQTLPLLQVLILRECAALGQQLLEPGAFNDLRELHIQDDYPMTAEGYPDLVQLSSPEKMDFIPPDIAALGLIEQETGIMDAENLVTMQAVMKAKAVECMSMVLSLPHMHMHSISGNGSLIRLGLP